MGGTPAVSVRLIMSIRTFRSLPTEGNTSYPRLFGTHGAVACEHYLAAHAAADILKNGGNAVDAAVAATLVEGVVNPQMHTIGGECPMLIQIADSRDVVCVNGNTAAPARATPQAFRERGLSEIPDEGILAAGVPAALGALVTALERYGRLGFADAVAHALDLARAGFPVHAGLIRQHKFGIEANAQKFRARWPGSVALYLPGGSIPKEGELFRNPALAQMFGHLTQAERSAAGNRSAKLNAVVAAFYQGDIAQEIVKFSQAHDGLLELSDLSKFETRLEAPARVEFGDATVYKCGAWDQGPALLQTLTILKRCDLKALGHNSADYLHALIEATKLAYADREQYYADPEQVEVPLAQLLSDDYGRLRHALIDFARASAEIRPGDPEHRKALLAVSERLGGKAWGPGTVHVDVIDRDGNMAAFTPSGGWIRSAEVIPALGFPLTCRMMTFYLAPSHHPNVVAPFKRPRTTISPSLAQRRGQAWMVFGSMGGDLQDQWQLQFFLNRYLFEMPLQQAIEAPKFSSEHFPGFFAPHDFIINRVRIEPRVDRAVLNELERRGHDLDIAPDWSEGFLLAAERHIESGVLEAGCDPRGAKSEVFPAAALCW